MSQTCFTILKNNLKSRLTSLPPSPPRRSLLIFLFLLPFYLKWSEKKFFFLEPNFSISVSESREKDFFINGNSSLFLFLLSQSNNCQFNSPRNCSWAIIVVCRAVNFYHSLSFNGRLSANENYYATISIFVWLILSVTEATLPVNNAIDKFPEQPAREKTFFWEHRGRMR